MISYFASGTKFEVINRNFGRIDVNYFNRDQYRQRFKEICRQLHGEGLFNLTIEEIENYDTYKLSPFTTLNPEQNDIAQRVIATVANCIKESARRTIIIEGGAGTGKSVLSTYLAKLLIDANSKPNGINELEVDDPWTDLVKLKTTLERRARELKVAVVVPQQSLRASVKKTFEGITGLKELPIFSPPHSNRCLTR